MTEPQRFTDERGREWRLAIDVPTIKRIRDELSIDLLRCLEDQTVLSRLVDDVVQLVDVLWLVCRDQAEGAGIDDVEFGRRLVGDAIDRAVTAFLAALCDFFPPAKRAVMRRILDKIHQVEARTLERAMTIVQSDRIDHAIERHLDAAERDLFRQLEALSEPGGK